MIMKKIRINISIVSRFGHVFMAETGTSVGEISGQSKSINSCDFRPARPFRLITGSEDNTIAVFEGPPFKFKYAKFIFYYNC
jgi:WD40 repeat protein